MRYRLSKWKASVTMIKEERAAAVRLQALARKRAAKKEVERMKAQQARYEDIVRKCVFKINNALINKVFNSISGYATRSKAIKRMAGASLGNFKGYVLHKWRRTVDEIKEDKQWAATYIQKMYRGRIGKKKLKARRTYVHAAMQIQRWWRCVLAKKLVKKLKYQNMLQNQKVMQNLQKMFKRTLYLSFRQLRRNADNNIKVRKHLKEKMTQTKGAALAQWKDFTVMTIETKIYSATKIQCVWEGKKARRVLQNLKHRRNCARKIQRFWRNILFQRKLQWWHTQNYCATVIQRHWRGVLGRRRYKKTLVDYYFFAAHSSNYPVLVHCFQRGLGGIQDARGNSLLHIAAKTGSKRVVKLCLKNGLNINYMNLHGKTPLHYLASSSMANAKLMDYMIMHGATTDMPDYEGYTPLMEAARMGNLAVRI